MGCCDDLKALLAPLGLYDLSPGARNEAELFALAAQAAEEGAENSKNFVSKFGRAKSYGAKTIGTPDAGAVSMARFFHGLAKD